MTIDAIKAIVEEAGGPKHVLGFRFANGYKVVFSEHVLDLEEDFKVFGDVEIFIYEQHDHQLNKGKSYIIVDEIVQVYTVVDTTKKIYIRDFME